MTRTAWAVVVGLVLAGPGVAVASPSLRRIGVMTDLGVPDGGTAALVYRPVGPVRFNLGVGHNLVSPGVRGGITLIPLGTWFTPTVSVSYGRFFDGDANPMVQRIAGDPTLSSPMLGRVGYDFADAHLGLELGRERVTFYLHGGVTQITGQVHGLEEAVPSEESADVSVTFTHAPDVSVRTLSARLGFVVYL